MKYEVNVYIVTSWRGPAKRKGAAMWIVEYKKDDRSITRQGILKLENGTENQGALLAVIEAVKILKKPCAIRVFTQCEHIINTMQNHWMAEWEKNGWNNAKGNPVRNVKQWQQVAENLRMHVYTFESGHHEFLNFMKMEIGKEMKNWIDHEGANRCQKA